MKATYTRKTVFSEIDSGGALYFANYLSIADEARNDIFDINGIGFLKLMTDQMCFVVSKSEVEYKKPIRLSESILIETQVKKTRSTSLECEHIFKLGDSIHAVVRLTLVLVNMEKGRPIKIPEYISEKING